MTVALTQITNHFNQALVKLVPPFWGKPRIAALLQAMINRVQELEDAAWEVLETYTLEGADTARLDVLGKIVGQPRFWAEDETYRKVIRGKIRTNRSRGLTDDLIEVVHAVTPTSEAVHTTELGNASMLLWTDAEIDEAAAIALKFLLPKARAAGVQLHFLWAEGGTDDGFVWDESNWNDASDVWFSEAVL